MKALQLHPDRNLENVALATQKFAEVQAAYDVLSDPQERAWYDSHRDAILRGDENLGDDEHPTSFRNVRLTSTEEIHNLMSKFNATVPFTNDPAGFFGIAGETFDHLALEEDAAGDTDGEDLPEYPTFGSSDDDYESVVKPFYTAWSGFSTRKSFAWKDKYRLSDAPDRRVRRLMEKENKKIRDEAVRDFNDAVRFLVTFVRKRDPRYLPNTQTEKERQKSMREAAATQAAKARAVNREKLGDYETPAWVQAGDEIAEQDEFLSSGEDSEAELMECIVCRKVFKSVQQLETHERSKKHTKALQNLRRQMRKEGADLNLEAATLAQPHQNSDNGIDPANGSCPEGSGEKLGVRKNSSSEQTSTAAETQHRGPESPVRRASTANEDEDENTDDDDDDTIEEDDDYAPLSVVQDRLSPSTNRYVEGSVDKNAGDNVTDSTIRLSLEDEPPRKKVGKAKKKREKKAAQSAEQKDTVCFTTTQL
jgi:DnaJ family protein A protein 5